MSCRVKGVSFAIMIKLLCFAVAAGMVVESSQQGLNILNAMEPFDEPEEIPLPLRAAEEWSCDNPTHIKCWTDWFDRDDPDGSGDWEKLADLREAHPGKICPNPSDIDARTLSGLTAAEAGDLNTQANPSMGFVCRNHPNKMCNDYRVRFSCHPPYCVDRVCWTNWFNNDNADGAGDSELLSNLRTDNPGERICDTPLYIEAAVNNTGRPAVSTGDVFHVYNPTVGFVCRNADQKSGKCSDYKVRFGCRCFD